VVILGTPTAESSETYALTCSTGDPTWAGALAGISLALPVYHILEPEVKDQIDPALYDQQVGLSEMALDAESIIKTMRQVRAQLQAPG
jgi:betaine reductase